ncbi:MAG TPA: hypothetical protein VHQ93_04125, partial [Chitinophagaceae bacterium]|nr:hypothetical protein [Chitinophagaceae bacterium]
KMLVEAKNEKSEFANFLHVTGLQASSVEYYSRLATLDKVTKNYYHFMGGIMGAALNSFFSSKDLNYSMVGLNLVHDPEKVNLKDLTFRKGLNLPPLTGPVIDKDPGTPLSETAQLSFNYIQWMLDNTSQSVVMNEEIKDKDGNKIPVPKALLYQTLRHAYLTSIKEASHFTLKKKMPAINQIDFHETGIMNLNDATTRIAKDELANVDAAKIGLTNTKKPVANYLLDAVKLKDLSLGDIYPIDLADFKNALTVLAKMPTARLERVFAEHLDLCGYRLDAWLNGIVNCRLNYLKSLRQQNFANNVGNELHNEITDGIHIGSFGWVEDLRPAQGERKKADAQEITRIFGDAVTGTVTEDSANAGFILTPSLSHAVTAAILRNAYLTHAEKDNEDVMSVNLSSERVRNALFYMEGLRNGQDLGALLGYQLERGLHERHPGVEIDEYIYILREQFPLISGKLTKIDDPNATAETIEARNVINGYDLLEAVRGKKYPYQVTGLPVMPPNETADPVNFKKANAIATEIKRLEDSLDAIGDLSLAESMYQVVGGNYDRARGILQALTEGKNPPDFQVMNTPRSGKTITHRVAIAFDINEVTGWHTPLTPRAKANRHLNAWLKKILPDPKLIQWIVSGDAIGNSTITLDDLPLEPIDIVFMTGERLGDISSELERNIVHHFRSANNIKDEMISFFFRKDPETADDKAIVFHPEVADPGKTPLTDIFPLLKSLKKLLGKCRSLTAQDLMLPSEGQNLKIKDVKGYYDEATPALKDLKDLFDRTNASMISLGNLFTPLKNFYDTSIKPLYDVFNNDRSLPLAPAWNAHLDTLRLSLFSFVAYGIPEALPANLENSGDMKQKIDTLVAQTQIVLKLVQKKLTEAGALVTTLALPADEKKHQQIIDQKLSDYKGASQQILGKDFTILPLFKIHNTAGLSISITASKNLTDELQVEEWLQSVARVRPSVQQLNRAIINHDLLNKNSMSLIPVQLPFKAGDKWVGLPFGDMELAGDMASIMLQQVPSDVTALQCGLFIDEWVELIPAEKETAGITFHFNRPNAVAPQSILLAVSPEINGKWSWDDLLAIINETLDLSKLRVVEPDMIMETEYADILPTVLTSFDNSMLSLSTFFNHNVFVKQ